MSEPYAEPVMIPGAHDHHDIRSEIAEVVAEVAAVKAVVEAEALVAEPVAAAEESAQVAEVAAVEAVEASYDAQADVQALRDELQVFMLEIREARSQEPVVVAPLPESEFPEEHEETQSPPEAEHKSPKKAKNKWSYWG